MRETVILTKALHEVNRDIAGMLRRGVRDEKARKLLADAREYRRMLEDDLEHAARKESEVQVIGVIVIDI